MNAEVHSTMWGKEFRATAGTIRSFMNLKKPLYAFFSNEKGSHAFFRRREGVACLSRRRFISATRHLIASSFCRPYIGVALWVMYRRYAALLITTFVTASPLKALHIIWMIVQVFGVAVDLIIVVDPRV